MKKYKRVFVLLLVLQSSVSCNSIRFYEYYDSYSNSESLMRNPQYIEIVTSSQRILLFSSIKLQLVDSQVVSIDTILKMNEKVSTDAQQLRVGDTTFYENYWRSLVGFEKINVFHKTYNCRVIRTGRSTNDRKIIFPLRYEIEFISKKNDLQVKYCHYENDSLIKQSVKVPIRKKEIPDWVKLNFNKTQEILNFWNNY